MRIPRTQALLLCLLIAGLGCLTTPDQPTTQPTTTPAPTTTPQPTTSAPVTTPPQTEETTLIPLDPGVETTYPEVYSFTLTDDPLCLEEGKPLVELFSTTWCPHCTWVKPVFDPVMLDYLDDGTLAVHHWEIDTGDDTLTQEIETEVSADAMRRYETYNPRRSIPTFVFGCKYVRVGNAYEREDDRDAEEELVHEVAAILIDATP